MPDIKNKDKDNEYVLSFLAVRQCLGYLGLALPLALAFGAILVHDRIESSISDFYYSPMSDVFVGSMAAIGVFLFTYKGYRKNPGEWISDRLVARAAGIGAVAVALIPTLPHHPRDCTFFQCLAGVKLAANIHLMSAALFFSMLAVFCLWMFPKTKPDKPPSAQKLRRNRIYYGCGTVLLIAMAGLLIHSALLPEGLKEKLDAFSVIFWLESLGVWAFGISWLVKGEAISLLNDPEKKTKA